jgi:hypothetical protein
MDRFDRKFNMVAAFYAGIETSLQPAPGEPNSPVVWFAQGDIFSQLPDSPFPI